MPPVVAYRPPDALPKYAEATAVIEALAPREPDYRLDPRGLLSGVEP